MSHSTTKQKATAKKTKAPKVVLASSTKTKPASVSKKPAVKKTVVKKAAKSQSIKPKTALKSVKPSKPSTNKSVKSSSSPTKAAKPTLKDLHNSIADLETRMKRANTLTRKSVTALETTVTALDSRTRKKSATDKAALTRKVNQLSKQLTQMVGQTQKSVNSDLKTALSNPTVENLQSAITRADQRLSHAENVQAEAISKINRHLSSIATAVDARIAQEETARTEAIEALKTETSEKIETVEQDTAQALENIGNKIIELSDEIKRRSEAHEISLREKVSEIAQQTQAEFKDFKTSSNSVSGNDGETRRLERKIFSLTNRLEELENNLTHVNTQSFVPPTPTPAAAPEIVTEAVPETISQAIPEAATPPKLSVVPTRPVTASMQDAFTPSAQTIAANPYVNTETAQSVEVQEPPAQDSHIPKEFDPRQALRDLAPKAPEPPIAVAPLPVEPPAPLMPPAPPIPPALENIMPAPAVSEEQSIAPYPAVDLAPQPYSDPAYAEHDDTLADVRIGGEPVKGFKPPKLSGRNLRVAALATGVAVIGLVAAKGMLGQNDGIKTPQIAQKNTATASINTPQNTAPVVVEPIGNYEDNKITKVTGEAANTLNAAASAGDSVAQFQLGLSYLEQGRTNEGVDLIRKSANQNQPAAQYRLAKLYEVGEGVAQDASLARQLTERAARNGNRIAMHDLALYYAEGRGGITAELPTAANWFKKAAERGVVDSQFNLGVLYESGQGLPKSMTDAFVWYSIAAAQGDQFAKKRIDILSDSMTPANLTAAQTRIEKFKPVKIDETANGIFRNVAWAKPEGSSKEKVTQVKEVQSLLTELGYDIGGADGSMGPRTRAAIISFEQANGLPETGRVNTALLERLELAAGA